MSDTRTSRPAPVAHACGHPFCPGAAAGYGLVLAAHTPARPLLTADGEAFFHHLLQAAAAPDAIPGPFGPPAPCWDGAARRLWLGARLLRAFRQPAPHQTALLAVFQARGWVARRIDDPLPGEPGDGPGEAQHRRYETVKNLNRGLPPGTIRFRVDGVDVWWEPCAPADGA